MHVFGCYIHTNGFGWNTYNTFNDFGCVQKNNVDHNCCVFFWAKRAISGTKSTLHFIGIQKDTYFRSYFIIIIYYQTQIYTTVQRLR